MLNIKKIREQKNITQDEMVAKSGIPKRSYVDYENEKSDIQLSKLRKIATILNVTVGELIGETKSTEKVIVNNDNNNDNLFDTKQKVKNKLSNLVKSPVGIPLIPISAMAGFGSGCTTVMEYETGRYVVPEFTELNVDFMIQVKGSSMYPKYNSGDLVACKKLLLSDVFFQWNKVYVLDTEQGALIKRIKKGNDIEHILLVSDNVNYDPFELHLSKIYAVALVVGVIRLE